MKKTDFFVMTLLVGCCIAWSFDVIAVTYDPIVEEAQIRLVELGYDPGPIDGKIGKKTTRTIKSFQQDNNLEITSTLNEETLRELDVSFQFKRGRIIFEQKVNQHREQLGTLLQARQYLNMRGGLVKNYMKKLDISRNVIFKALRDNYPPKTSVLFYAYEDDGLHTWLINKNGIQVYEKIRVSEKHLDTVIFKLRRALRITSLQLPRLPPDIRGTVLQFNVEDSGLSLDDSVAEVTNILLPPKCIRRLSSTQHLIIVPTLGIGTVPFSMLQPFGSDQYLVDQMSITIAPSLFNIAEGVRTWHTHPENPLIVGNPLLPLQWPRLPGAEKEVESIAEVFNASPLIGKDATEEAVETLSRSADLLYFATHGIGDRDHPVLKSFLALTNTEDTDGKWTAEEIQQKGLRANLAVLSACQTGLGKEFDAGVVGLARAFQLAGVPRVVMSLWNVDDKVTSELMQSFALHFQKDVPSEALRKAMLDIKQHHPHPSKWASFTLFGDAR
jgi:hypothetical protein